MINVSKQLSANCFLQCFDAVGRVTGMASCPACKKSAAAVTKGFSCSK